MEIPTGFYPVIMVDDVAEASAFYRRHFGFESVFEADWYVSLRRGAFELAILRFDHPTIPSGFERAVSGLLLNYEVEDAAAAHRRLVDDEGLEAVLPLRDEAFGQRHFIIVAPGGVLVDVIEPIEATGEYAAG